MGLFGYLASAAAFGTVTDFDQRFLPDAEAMILDLPTLSRTSIIQARDGTGLERAAGEPGPDRSFGTDASGELYVTAGDALYRLIPDS